MSVQDLMVLFAPSKLLTYGESNGGINNFISAAENRVCRSYYGNQGDEAVAYYALHLIQMKQDAETIGSGSGPIKTKREKTVQVEFDNTSNNSNDGPLNLTKWGREFLLLLKTNVVPQI